MSVPEGWTFGATSQSTRFGREGELRRVACGGLPRDYPPDSAYDADCAIVRFDVIDASLERCPDGIEPPVGSSFDDLVAHIARLPGVTGVADVTIDGYRGKHIAYSPRDQEDFDCLVSGYKEVWLLDVDGVRVMIGSTPGGALDLNVPKKVVQAEIRAMVESIHFER
jgi:hypothetical protein